MRNGGAMKRVRPERFVNKKSLNDNERMRIPSKASSIYDDENSK